MFNRFKMMGFFAIRNAALGARKWEASKSDEYVSFLKVTASMF